MITPCLQGTVCRSESVFSHRQAAATYSDSRQGEGNQSSHHHDEVQDVPHVSEVGAIVQDESLVYHLEDTHTHTEPLSTCQDVLRLCLSERIAQFDDTP